jgi:transcriptional regulator with XRE-family HTH domain
MTDTFGARLRRAREQRQVSLADIAARTKIKASLFEELERDDASRWPVGIFRRSFMRAYAQSVGLDPDDTVREFLRLFPDPHEPGPTAVGAPEPAVPSPAPLLPAAAAVATEAADQATPPTQPPGPAALRLTLVETGLPFTGGRMLADARRRWSAAAWDLGSLLVIAVSVFVVMDAFWMPFSVTAICYYIGGVLFLGNSPGVCLFAPKPAVPGEGGGGQWLRRARARHAEPAPVRHAEPAFLARRWQKEVRT